MDEADWLATEDSWPMLRFLENQKYSQRTIHLFVCGYCRSLRSDRLHSNDIQDALLTAECFADHLTTDSELGFARARLSRENWAGPCAHALWAARIATGVETLLWGESLPWARVLWAAKYMRGPRIWRALSQSEKSRVRIQCDLLRCVFGNPFRPVTLDPSWRTSTVTALAQAAYEERILPTGTLEHDRLAILADALEDAGCDHAAILSHLRGPGPHVRGCWAVDLLLGKE